MGELRARLTIAAAAALIGAGVSVATMVISGHTHAALASGVGSLVNPANPATTSITSDSIPAAAAKIEPSVVTINVNTATDQNTGSGLVIRQDGYILTNNHVIAAAISHGEITVTMADGTQAIASVVGTDPSDDLAVIHVKLTGLSAATFADSRTLVVGQAVVAVGAPLGLSATVTAGIVSNTARPVQTGNTMDSQSVFDAVQTDAAINPGNSGGPLVNLAGNVVGINAAMATDRTSGGLQVPGQPLLGQPSQSGSIGIGFAIPADEASRVAGQLITNGRATHAILGVTVIDGPHTAAATAAGALVHAVSAGGPAAHAGLAVGDFIVGLDGQRIPDAASLVAAVRSHAPNESVVVTYEHGSTKAAATVVLAAGSS